MTEQEQRKESLNEKLQEAGVKADRNVTTDERGQGEMQREQGVEGKMTEPRAHGRLGVVRDKRISRENEDIKGDVRREIMAEKAHLGKAGIPDIKETPRQMAEEGKVRSPVHPGMHTEKEEGSVIKGPHRPLEERVIDTRGEKVE